MPKFRKKPVVVEAEKFDGTDGQAERLGLLGVPVHEGRNAPRWFFVKTLEGKMRLSDGDWIITGVKGERYPCKPDIFDATYEPVEPGTSPKPSEAVCAACRGDGISIDADLAFVACPKCGGRAKEGGG